MIPHADLVPCMGSALPWFDVIERLGDEAGFGPTRMVAVKAPVSIVEADELSFAVGSPFFENDGNALEVPGAIAPQPDDDTSRDAIGIVDGQIDEAIVAASGRGFAIEVVHGRPSKLLRWGIEPGPSPRCTEVKSGHWALLLRTGSRRSPSGAALARGARPRPCRAERSEGSLAPRATVTGTVNGETWAANRVGRSVF